MLSKSVMKSLTKHTTLFGLALRIFRGLLLCFFLLSFSCYSISGKTQESPQKNIENQKDTLIKKANILYLNQEYKAAMELYKGMLQRKHSDSVSIVKNMALGSAELRQVQGAVLYTEQYIKYTADIKFPKNAAFNKVRNSEQFKKLEKKYVPKLSIWSILYFYTAIVGTFITLILNFKRNSNRVANLLMSIFVFLHSLFIIHICLYITNYKYYFPHILLSTASFSFLYGPLMYFYFKRVTQNYVFRSKDLLHLLPSLCYFIYVFPIYSLSETEKLNIILNEQKIYSYLVTIIITKFASLLIYGYLVWKIYRSSVKNAYKRNKYIKWQKNILNFYVLYTISYVIYALTISNVIEVEFLYHAQIVAMSLLVLYVGYTAYVQPEIFNNNMIITDKDGALFKYKKSGLTDTYSNELRDNLIRLLVEEKIYRDNNVNLEILSEKLGTTRHNTSQVINEHFDVNFFELINKYRIYEALEILKNDNHKNLNIIDIAYEVGFNNKVTFNKAFKKETSLTPTQYLDMLARNEFIRLKNKFAK